MDYTVTEYTDFQDEQIVDLHTRLINGGRHMSRSCLRWLYTDNPFVHPPLFVVVRLGEQIVGMRGLVGTSWIIDPGGEPTILPHSNSLIVHPDHRNRGLFLLIQNATVAAAAQRRFSSLISLSAGELTQELCLVSGWKAVGELEKIYRYPARPRRLRSRIPWPQKGRYRLRQTAIMLGYIPVKPPSTRAIDRALQQIVTVTSPRIQLSSDADYAEMSDLAESVGSGSIRASRSETFLRWRLKNPHRKYRFLYWRDSSLRGYMILAWTRRDANRVMIVDYAVEDAVVFAELIDALVQSQHGDLSMMSSTLPRSLLQTAIAGGFQPDPTFEKEQRRRFLVYPLSNRDQSVSLGEGAISYPDNWHVSLLDTMNA